MTAPKTCRTCAHRHGPMESEMEEDRIEHAYWRFDARRKGYEQWRNAPMTERDAFKAEMRNALSAEKMRSASREGVLTRVRNWFKGVGK